MLSDIEIARNAPILPIKEIAKKLDLLENDMEYYGKYKAKINFMPESEFGKLILVSAMSPTPFGEGKTTISIGLCDALNLIGKKSCLALRQPSLGPVFGIKGGACGGGYSQVIPMEDINLHFTGDFHAITYANNLLSSIIDNHINQGNKLDINEVIWKRCIDLNDRALREIEIGLGDETNGIPRKDGFTITAASEVMAIFCLANSLEDLKRRLGNILIGYSKKGKEVLARDLKADEAMTILLKDAFKPNLVQTLEGNPAIIHGGPFANIAHGCNSIQATKMALQLSDFVVTEAGFGAELGAEKFFNIKCRKSGFIPNVCVLVVTARSIKYNSDISIEEVKKENLNALQKGFANVKRHIKNIKNNFKINTIIAINKFAYDTQNEIELIKKLANDCGIKAVVDTSFTDGGKGAIELAEEVSRICEKVSQNINYTYNDNDEIEKKIEKIAKNIYGAKQVVFSEEAKEQLKRIKDNKKYIYFPVCIAKNQYSFTCDSKKLGAPEDFVVEIRELKISAGAEFIVAITGKMLLMPGLSANPNLENMKINSKGEISGLM